MADKIFLDTNILVYAYDRHDPTKQMKAQSLVIDAIQMENTVISAQVLSEFFITVTRRIQHLLSVDEARQLIEFFSILPVVDIDLNMVKRAIDTHKRFKINYWDALIVGAAERARCNKIISEDLNPGQEYYDMVVENPFIIVQDD